MILYPAFRIQQSMMLSTMGIDWWTSRRAALADGRKKERRDSDREVARRKKHAAKMKKREELRAKYDLAGGMWAYRFQEAARDASTASTAVSTDTQIAPFYYDERCRISMSDFPIKISSTQNGLNSSSAQQFCVLLPGTHSF